MFRGAVAGQSAPGSSAAHMFDMCQNGAHPLRCLELTSSASVTAHVVLFSHVTNPGTRFALATHSSAHTRSAAPTLLSVELRGMWRRAMCYSSIPNEALLRRRWHRFIFLSCSPAVAAVPVKIVRKPNLQEPEKSPVKMNFTNFIFKQFLCTMVLLISHTITRDNIIKRL